ncbi:isoprenylcysteine carboxylmethyltransferase family protein, partial [Candidatus Woesearchaeota archaeon]|nr:isoprenylcysteine carboxylmethyltransferase family protein [Candidatus Woesearchaeota archaeon]
MSNNAKVRRQTLTKMKEQPHPKILPPHVALGSLIIIVILHYIYPTPLMLKPFNYLGILFFALGLLILFWSFGMFKRKETPILPGQKPTSLVIEGPYKFTRNPMYLGVATALFGVAVYLGDMLAFLAPIVFFLFVSIGFIPREEKVMEKLFGKD